MTIICAPEDYRFTDAGPGNLNVVLYGHAGRPNDGAVGATARNIIQHNNLEPSARAWDLLSIALSVIAADTAARRDESPDGWTRQLDLHVAVSDPVFWTEKRSLLVRQLGFLTTDIWNINFLDCGVQPAPPKVPARPEQDSIMLLSGGLDSLIGAIDLVTMHGKNPFAVSQVSRGDKQTQSLFASSIGGGLAHLQLNHNAECPGQNERSQRARSFVFLAYGVLAATALKRYHAGERVTFYVCENGFISINPPLTGARLGSLSTRTTHPFFIRLFQELLDAADLRVMIENPYQFKTKGEMLSACADQALLQAYAHTSTSCGRYARNGYEQCGRCLPCLIRRASFNAWGVKDKTHYKFAKLSRNDKNHARYDDVRSAAMAVAAAKAEGFSTWAGPALSSALLGDTTPYQDVIKRGLDELATFLKTAGVM
jgi:7-cyano-7-deazaguanine synthase in queuosine biosynthesis